MLRGPKYIDIEIRFSESSNIREETLSTGAGNFQQIKRDLMGLWRSGMVFWQKCLRISNHYVID